MAKNRPRKPTRDEKKLMSKRGLKVENWLVTENTPDRLVCVSKMAGKRREIKKGE